jgi:serine/threonine-protein kinase
VRQPGDAIGKYRIERLLGQGGNGAVFVAMDAVLGRRVALKQLHDHFTGDPHVASRFRAEAEAMARLNHPNVVIVHDFLVEPATMALVMELVESGEARATHQRPQGPRGARPPARPRAAGAPRRGPPHARGIVHRDVKPANVMIARDGTREQAKVTDFGIARLLDGDRRTAANTTLGTLYYLAPEQAGNASVDARADVYSLGVTLYESLTGQVPFPYSHPAQVITAHVAERPVPPSARVPGIPPRLDAIVLGCLGKRPEERPRNGTEVADALAHLLRDAPIAPTTPIGVAPTRALPSAPPAMMDTSLAPTMASTPPHAATGELRTTPFSKPPVVSAPPPAPLVTSGSFGAPLSPHGRAEGEKSLALWISIGAIALVVIVCFVGGALACLTMSS